MSSERLEGLTWDEYRELQVPSQSDLKAVWSDPQLWYETNIAHSIDKPPSTPAQQWGRQCEAVLRDGLSDSVQVIPPDVLTSNGARRGKNWDEYRASQPESVTLVTEKEYESTYYGFERAWHNVQEHQYARALLYAGGNEWNVRYLWDADCLEMKSELDLINVKKRVIVDVKTSTENTPAAFAKDVIKWGYDVQAAAYLEAAAMAHCGDDWRWFWVVVQSKAPWKCEVYQASPEVLNHGFERLDEMRAWFVQCRDSGVWRSPTHGEVVELFLPPYLRRKIEHGE